MQAMYRGFSWLFFKGLRNIFDPVPVPVPDATRFGNGNGIDSSQGAQDFFALVN